jgi:hypothetical protein
MSADIDTTTLEELESQFAAAMRAYIQKLIREAAFAESQDASGPPGGLGQKPPGELNPVIP